MNIMVTGGTGNYGKYALNFLLEFAPEANLYTLVRNLQKAEPVIDKGITPRVADYGDKASMVKVFEGIDRLLLVSISDAAAMSLAIDAAKEAGVQFIAYTSLMGTETPKIGLHHLHQAVEQKLSQSGIDYTILRNEWYILNDETFLAVAKKTGKFYYATDKKATWASVKDLAEAGARAILKNDNPKIYNLGSQPHTYAELALATAKVLGRDLDIKKVSKAELLQVVDQAGYITFYVDFWQDYFEAGGNDEASHTPDELDQLLGHPQMTLEEVVSNYFEVRDTNEFNTPVGYSITK